MFIISWDAGLKKARFPYLSHIDHALVEHLRQQCAVQAYGIKHFQFPGILRTDQWLILVLTSRGDGTLSLVELAKEGPRMRLQHAFTEQEVSFLTPLLEVFPDYCPDEVLLAYLYGTDTEIQIAHFQKEVIQALNTDILGDLFELPTQYALTCSREGAPVQCRDQRSLRNWLPVATSRRSLERTDI